MKEQVKLSVTKYVTDKGEHTCALDFNTGEVCIFYRIQRFGTHETCIFAEANSRGYGKMLQRGVSSTGELGQGHLIPDIHCPIRRETFDHLLFKKEYYD